MTFLRFMAGGLWLLCGLAWLDMHTGNPTAVNGVIGAGVCALACSVLAVLERP